MQIRRFWGFGFVWLGTLWAVPPLTTIQDVLYKADGTPFNGVATIQWKSFEASDLSNIAPQSVTVKIINGVLRVRLVPTTNATPQATYVVRYHSDGKAQFEEHWAVPPSSIPLRVREVRVSAPASAPETQQIQESDVIGLVADLAVRPVKGPGYTPSRAAYISVSGALEAVVGNLTDCVRVDGTAGPCGSAAEAPLFVDGETPSGVVDGTNAVFTLANSPSPQTGLALHRNGLLQKQGLDYTISGNVITFVPGAVPQPGDVLTALYRLTGAPGGAQVHPLAEVLCSGSGSSTSAAVLTQLGTCVIAANSLRPGDRIDIRFDYSHQGSATGFSLQLRWGSTTLVSRSADAAEALVSGRADAAIRSAGAQWSAQSWGSALTLSTGAGNAADSLASPLVLDFLGAMAAATTDTLKLENYTVIRYPAQPAP